MLLFLFRSSQNENDSEISHNDNVFDNQSTYVDYPITNDLTREQSQSDECLAENSAAYSTEFQVKPAQIRSHCLTYPSALYNKQKTKSTPNLLNEISEEHDSELEDSPRNSPLLQRRSSQRRRKYHTCRLSPIHSRRSSCSSSDDDEILAEKRRLSGHHIASVTGVQSSHNTTEYSKDTKTNTNSGSRTKNISTLKNDLENEKNLEHLLFSTANFKLANIPICKYGRHFSDTNLTCYATQLKLKLYKLNNNHRIRCSSDTNLVSTLYQKSVLLSSEFTINKDLKYMKRGRNSSKTLSNLSLSSPIEEEEPTFDDVEQDYLCDTAKPESSKICAFDGNDCTYTGNVEFNLNSKNLFKTDSQSSKFHCFQHDHFSVPPRVVSTYSVKQAVQIIPAVAPGSVCCSLV